MNIPINDKRPQAVILIGIPASGKSTFCKRFFGESQGYVRINRDSLGNKAAVSTRLWQCLTARRSFVLDNTQVSREDRARSIALASAAGYEVCGYYMAARAEDCLLRNALRSGAARVPDAAIFSMAARLELPTHAEGFDRIFHVSWAEDGGYHISPRVISSDVLSESLERLALRMWKNEPQRGMDEAQRSAVAQVLRLDGRAFRTLTNRLFGKPFDSRFRAMMETTVHHLMNCGFRVVSAYHQSDEISLVLYDEEWMFNNRPAKLLSLMAGEASAAFSVALGQPAAFDCRLHFVRSGAGVRDYLRWRRADALRNAFNAYCYWTLHEEGMKPASIDALLHRLDRAEKKDMLRAHGVDFDNIPAWQKQGTLYYWGERELLGTDPRTGAAVPYRRRCVISDVDAAGAGV